MARQLILAPTEDRAPPVDTARRQQTITTIPWLPPEGGDTQLTEAQFREGGPLYDQAMSRLGSLRRPLLLLLPSDLATAPRRELDNHAEVRVGWEAVTNDALLALLHRGVSSYPTSTGTTPMCQPPQTTLAWSGTTSSRSSTTMGCTPPTSGGEFGGIRSAETLGAASAPPYWSFGTPFAGAGMPPGSAGLAPGPRPPTSRTPAVSAGRATLCPPPCRQVPKGVRLASRWPHAPGGSCPRARRGARRRRQCDGALRTSGHPRRTRRTQQLLPCYGHTCS